MIKQVDNFLYRGPRPQPADFDWIRSHFATVISLEGNDEDKKERLELAPVPVVSFPISAWQIYFSGISQAYLNAILAAIASQKSPILLHCQHGEDRTGIIVAAYRVTVSGWDKTAAMGEALHFGYRRWLNFGLNKTWSAFG